MSTEIANRYAKALFRLTPEKNQIEETLKILCALKPLLVVPSSFMHWMASPQIDINLKRTLIAKNFNDDSTKLLKNFLLYLLDKQRFQYLPEIIEEYHRLAINKLGMISVRLISSQALDAENKKKLSERLEAKFERIPHINEEIDPSLIAGNILIIGNQMLDSSLKGKLMRLKKHLLKGTP